MLYKIFLPVLLLSFLWGRPAVGQRTVKIYYHPNDYTGNLYYRTRFDPAGLALETKWFYVKAHAVTEEIVLPAEPDGTYHLYSGWTSFNFHEAGGKLIFDSPAEAASVKDTLNTVVLSFKTARVKIKTHGLSIPYVFSAYALIPLRQTTDGAKYNVLYGDTAVTLIKGMVYGINTQAYNALPTSIFKKIMPCNKTLIGYDMVSGIGTERVFKTGAEIFYKKGTDAFFDALTFTVDVNRQVKTDDSVSAVAHKNRLLLNTVKVNMDPSCISGGQTIYIPQSVAAGPRDISTKTKITVIKGLLNHLRWTDSKQHDNYYIWMPPSQPNGKKH